MRPQAVLVAVLAAALALPAAAQANDFQDVYREYKRTGTIKPCRFSDKQLRNAQQQTPPDIEQYAPSFLDAVTAAREARSGCGKKPAAAPPPPVAAQSPPPSTPTPVPPATAPTATTQAQAPPAPTVPVQAAVTGVASPPVDHPKRQETAPAAVWLLAGLGALALLAALAAALAWWFGWSAERWARPWRASIAEFADRFATGRAEFVDWLRTGA
jgi:hypothetical protein